jgi:lathosterol oxidase
VSESISRVAEIVAPLSGEPVDLVAAATLIFVFFYGQFLVAASVPYFVLWVWGKDRFHHRRIQQHPRRASQPKREFLCSTLSVLIFTALLTFIVWLTSLGYTRVYFDVDSLGWGYWCLSVGAMALVHDTYYYWAHRWMHHPRVFRHVHKLHHQFGDPTPYASYAFHPWEALVEVAWFLPLALVLPLHPGAVALYIVILTVLNVVSHMGYEFYPVSVARYFITSTHHNLHHSRASGHFMLYFNLWDRLMGTNHPDYEDVMRETVSRPPRGARTPAWRALSGS